MPALSVPAEVSAIAARLSAHGYQAVVVGGAVRDSLLGRPAKDWDLATDATPEQMVELFPGTQATTRFGTALVKTDKGIVEVTTFRTEAGYGDFRRPDRVAFTGDLQIDLARRDFTINAIAYDPQRKVLIDPFGGQADLRARRLRAVGAPSERFAEDALRLLRAVRFVAQLGFSLDPTTAAAVRHAAHLVRHLAAERVGMELLKMVTAPYASAGLRQMRDLGLAVLVLPELSIYTYNLGLMTMEALRPTDPALAFAALFHHAGPDPLRTAEIARARLLALGIGDDIAARAGAITRAAELPYHSSWSEADLARAIRGFDQPALAAGMSVRAACDRARTQAVTPQTAELVRRAQALYASGLPIYLQQLALNGDDLRGELGMKPSPELGRLLLTLQQAACERRVPNQRGPLLAYARGLLAR